MWAGGQLLTDYRLYSLLYFPKVLKLLGDALVRRSPYVHSYPCDWRTKKPVILRASRQWFIDTVGMKDEVIRAVGGVDIRWMEGLETLKAFKFLLPYD